MGYPADGVESLYRNPMAQVQKFLESQHPGHYKVYNLCSERSYPPEKFNNNVACYPFDDHNPPPLSMMKPFCEDVKQWLDAHPLNVAVVHCKVSFVQSVITSNKLTICSTIRLVKEELEL